MKHTGDLLPFLEQKECLRNIYKILFYFYLWPKCLRILCSFLPGDDTVMDNSEKTTPMEFKMLYFVKSLQLNIFLLNLICLHR